MPSRRAQGRLCVPASAALPWALLLPRDTQAVVLGTGCVVSVRCRLLGAGVGGGGLQGGGPTQVSGCARATRPAAPTPPARSSPSPLGCWRRPSRAARAEPGPGTALPLRGPAPAPAAVAGHGAHGRGRAILRRPGVPRGQRGGSPHEQPAARGARGAGESPAPPPPRHPRSSTPWVPWQYRAWVPGASAGVSASLVARPGGAVSTSPWLRRAAAGPAPTTWRSSTGAEEMTRSGWFTPLVVKWDPNQG